MVWFSFPFHTCLAAAAMSSWRSRWSEHLSSAALGMLIALHKRVREKGGVLRLCNIRSSIYEVFEITRLSEVLKILPSREEAVREATAS